MPESLLLSIVPMTIAPGWLDRRRVRVFCAGCGEGVAYGRELIVNGQRVWCQDAPLPSG